MSLTYEIETEGTYKDIPEPGALQLKEWYDFSDYPKDHLPYDESNKKMIGKFKAALNGKIIEEGVFLKPRQYAFRVDNEDI